tara:strand:- start:3290 stop:4336 length:1047 start_codon:yes stop_codon:yes gene_type:complete
MGMIKLPKQSQDFFYKHADKIFETGALAEGDWNLKVADWSKSYTGASFALAVNSNGAGLHAILRVLKEFRGKKKVFIQSNTMYGVKTIAISSGLELCGYVDCSLDYIMPTYDQVSQFVDELENPSECVFLITHIGGWINPDIEEIAKLCKEKNISLVEDCAHSLGSLLNEKHSGLFGDAGVYSLYATKAVPVGEGGIVVSNDEDLSNMVQKFSMYDRFDQQLDLGVNIRMSEINALLTYSVITEIEEIIENKYEISNKYIEACQKSKIRYIDPVKGNQRSNFYKFTLLARTEDPVLEFSKITQRTSPVYDYALGNDPENIASKHICLPIWYGLEDEIVKKVCDELISS